MRIKSPLARYNYIGICGKFVKSKFVQNYIYAASELGIQESYRARAETACGTCARKIFRIEVEVSFENISHMAKPSIEQFNLFGIRAFLRSKDISRTVNAEKRISDIARSDYGNTKRFFGRNNMFDLYERSADRNKRIVIFIEKTKTELRRHTYTAVVSRAAAETQNNTLRAAIYGIAYKHTDARSSCNGRVGSVARKRQSGTGGGFNNSRAAFEHIILGAQR